VNKQKPLDGVLVASDVDGVITREDTLFSFFNKYGKLEKARALNERLPGADIAQILSEIARENEITKEELALEGNEARLFRGAKRFYSKLEKLGAQVCLLTATYEPIAEGIAARLELKKPAIMASRVRIAGGKVKGVGNRVMEGVQKKRALRRLCRRFGIPLSKVVGIGDSPGDREFMDEIAQGGGLCIWMTRPGFPKIEREIMKWFGGETA